MEISAFEESLERGWSALKGEATRRAYAALPGLAVASLEIDAEGLESAEALRLFSRDLREIDPTLNDHLLDLYGRSEQALAGHFTFFNRSQNFEGEIDWECPQSASWRSELHAFDFALDLALTYRISLEERYARHLRYLIAHWIASNPPFQGTGWRVGPLARRVRNWILAGDLAREDWERDAEFRELVTRSLALGTTHLFRHAGSADSASEALDIARAMLVAGKLFSGSRGAELRSAALEMVSRDLVSRLDPETARAQARPDLLLRLAATVVEAILFGAEVKRGSGETIFLKEGLHGILTELEGLLLPDGNLPGFGPTAGSSKDNLADVAALAAVLLDDPAWKSLAGEFGIWPYMLLGEEGKTRFERLPDKPTKAGHRLLPVSGCWRLNGSDASALVLNGRAPAGPEDHADYLTFEMAIRGHRVIVDSGAYEPEGEVASGSFQNALAHNVLLVDGAGSSSVVASLEALWPKSLDEHARFTGLRLADHRFAVLGLRHERAWYRLENNTWAILDRLDGQGSHSGVELLHFYPTFELELAANRAVARSRALTVTVIPVGQSKPSMTASRGNDARFPGWYAPDFGVKYSSSVLALEWANLEVPWAGGFLIIPGGEADFRPGQVDTNARTVSFELSGNHYCLRVGSSGAEQPRFSGSR